MTHQRQIEPPALLCLPDMHQFMNEQRLQTERRTGKVVAVMRARRVEMHVPHRCHHRTLRLKREEPAAADPHGGKIERAAKNAFCESLFAQCERTFAAGRNAMRDHMWSITPSMAPISSTFAKALTLSPLASVKVTSTSLPGFTVLARLNSMT